METISSMILLVMSECYVHLELDIAKKASCYLTVKRREHWIHAMHVTIKELFVPVYSRDLG